MILLLDHAITTGSEGTPLCGVTPASIATSVSTSSAHTAVGYGQSCVGDGTNTTTNEFFGLRRFIDFPGQFATRATSGCGSTSNACTIWYSSQIQCNHAAERDGIWVAELTIAAL